MKSLQANPVITVLMPVRDDWAPAAELIRRLDQSFLSLGAVLRILLVDDASQEPFTRGALRENPFACIQSITILRLRRNLGHQRAIATGIVHLERSQPCDAVLVMDADGEDTPEGARELALRMFEGEGPRKAILAARTRRTENLQFQFFYHLYRGVHWLMTGVSVRVGNFSILPFTYLRTLSVMTELWNHYAAALYRSGLPFETIPIPRGRRISGESRMNFVALCVHGMSAIAVFGDIVGTRVLMVSGLVSLLLIGSLFLVLWLRLFTAYAIPGWTAYAAGLLVVILVQVIAAATSFTFNLLFNHINASFVPARDCESFVDTVIEVR